MEEILAASGVNDILKSQASMISSNEATSLEVAMPPSPPAHSYPEPPPSPPDIDIPAMKEDLSEVTSTVTIKTPEESEESMRPSTNPAVWKGLAKFGC